MREPFVSFLNAIASRILTEEVSRTQTLQTNEHIARATQSVAKWTKGMVAVGALTAGILVLQYLILRTSDETYRITNRPYVFFAGHFYRRRWAKMESHSSMGQWWKYHHQRREDENQFGWPRRSARS
jgi:hypothetical protein